MVRYTIESEELSIKDPKGNTILILKSNRWCQFNTVPIMASLNMSWTW